MKIEDALNLMGRNPAVDFPWEDALIGLVNSFLSTEAQLDPRTATAMDVKNALANLDAVTQQMILLTSVGGQATPTVSPEAKPSDKGKNQFRLFMCFGGALCLVAVMLAAGIGGGVNSEAVVEVVKLIVEVMKLVAPVPVPTP